MKFAVLVGDVEKTRLEYHSNQFLGSTTITVNQKPVKKVVHLVNEPVLEVHSLVVGNDEKTSVRIEKQRKPLLGYTSRLYVNDRLLHVFQGL
jgi:hypothetical protein